MVYDVAFTLRETRKIHPFTVPGKLQQARHSSGDRVPSSVKLKTSSTGAWDFPTSRGCATGILYSWDHPEFQ